MSVSGIDQSLSGNSWMYGVGQRGTKDSEPDYDQLAKKVLEDRDQDDDGQLSFSEMHMSRGRFDSVDTDSDGYVSAEELSNHMSSGDNNTRLNRLAAAIIQMQDSDGDGKLSESESDLSRDDFEAADTDGDGYLTQSEIANALGASANQNGQTGTGEAGGVGSGEATDQEFSGPGSENLKGTYKMGSSDEDASKKAGKSEQMDLNGDGVVSPEEVQAVMMHGLAKAKSMVASGELTIKTAPNGVSAAEQGEGAENSGATGATGATDAVGATGKGKKLAWGKEGQDEEHVSGRHGVPMWLRRRAMEAYGGQSAGAMSQMQNLAAGAQDSLGALGQTDSDDASTTVASAMPSASVAAGVVGAGDMISAHI
ncbi:MAG: hypothetical protein ACK5JO_14070 [Halodesulfovibrio sp.]